MEERDWKRERKYAFGCFVESARERYTFMHIEKKKRDLINTHHLSLPLSLSLSLSLRLSRSSGRQKRPEDTSLTAWSSRKIKKKKVIKLTEKTLQEFEVDEINRKCASVDKINRRKKLFNVLELIK